MGDKPKITKTSPAGKSGGPAKVTRSLPGEKTEKPSGEHRSSAPAQSRPAQKSAQLTSKSAQPASKSAQPAPKAAQPVSKPAPKPAQKPAQPASKPTQTTPKPAQKSAQPASKSAQPVSIPAPKSAQLTSKPASKSAQLTSKPAQTAAKPASKPAEKLEAKPETKTGTAAKQSAKKPPVKHNFRTTGRTGKDAYKRLYSKENAKPRSARAAASTQARPAQPRAQAYNQARVQAQQKTARSYSSTLSAVIAQKKNELAEKKAALFERLPNPVKGTFMMIDAIAQKVRSWKYSEWIARALLIAALFTFMSISSNLSAGIKAFEKSGVYENAMDDFAYILGYSPDGEIPEKGAMPEKTRTYAFMSDTDASDTDIDLSDSDYIFNVVSTCDMVHHETKFSDRAQQIKMLTQAGKNEKKAKKRGIKLYAVAEAGSTKFKPSEFALDGNDDISYIVAPSVQQLNTPGVYTLRVESGGRESNVLLFVKDTAAPEFTLKDIDAWVGDKIKPSMFLDTINEFSDIIVSYDGKGPDMELAGEQLVYINVTDIYGNKSEMKAAKVNVQIDTDPPVISGAKNKNIVIGSAVSYKQGITVTDNRDKPEDITLKVDTSKVKPNEKGTYEVTYTAVDTAGNAASVTVKYRFGTEDELSTDVSLDEYVNKIAKSIFKSGMTQAQQLKAIYNWCRAKIGYSGHSTKDNWKNAAIRGFKSRGGDCYTYFACSKALMEYCGIKNIDVVKVRVNDSESHHYWSLVDVGTGYYHFDATPRVGGFNGFMRTDSQLSEYSKSHKNSHRFDSGKYPATPKDKFSMEN